MNAPRPGPHPIVLIVLVLVVAGGGLFAGTAVRSWLKPIPPPEPLVPGLTVGMTFPDVPLIDETGATLSTHAALGDSGGVVLLLDPECDPCRLMAARWQELQEQGALGRKPLIGIVESGNRRIAAFRADHAISFPVHADTARVFMNAHHVTDFPLCLWVSRDHVVRRATFDPYADAPAESLATL